MSENNLSPTKGENEKSTYKTGDKSSNLLWEAKDLKENEEKLIKKERKEKVSTFYILSVRFLGMNKHPEWMEIPSHQEAQKT